MLHATRNTEEQKIVLFTFQLTNKVSIPHFHLKILKLQLSFFTFKFTYPYTGLEARQMGLAIPERERRMKKL